MKYLILIFTALSLSNCNSQRSGQQATNGELLGEISRSDLQQQPHRTWFADEYNNYDVNRQRLNGLNWNNTEIHIVMGTWCPDSQREVPRFFKVLDAVEYPAERVTMVAVDRSKSRPEATVQRFDVEYVPTFVVMRRGQEIGRIVEAPTGSLEAELRRILSAPMSSGQ